MCRVLIYVVCLIFMFLTYCTSSKLGSIDKVYDRCPLVCCLPSPCTLCVCVPLHARPPVRTVYQCAEQRSRAGSSSWARTTLSSTAGAAPT